jgi:hypothetical protein
VPQRPAAARGEHAGLRGHRRHGEADLRLRQGRRRSRLHRREGPERAARHRLDAWVRAGDLRRPVASGPDQQREGRPPVRRRHPADRQGLRRDRAADRPDGLGVLPVRHRRRSAAAAGPLLDHRAPASACPHGDRRHPGRRVDADQVHQRDLGRRHPALGQRSRGRGSPLHCVHEQSEEAAGDRAADRAPRPGRQPGQPEPTVHRLPPPVGSAWGAVSGLLPTRFPRPPAEPDVRLSPHPALHVPMPKVNH